MKATSDRDYIVIKDKPYLHTTVQRDWVCGTCGSALKGTWNDEAPHWRTVCANDASHDPDSFVHKSTWEYLEHRHMMNAAQARDVFEHLPKELQEAILATE
jgi:hypothetical protein